MSQPPASATNTPGSATRALPSMRPARRTSAVGRSPARTAPSRPRRQSGPGLRAAARRRWRSQPSRRRRGARAPAASGRRAGSNASQPPSLGQQLPQLLDVLRLRFRVLERNLPALEGAGEREVHTKAGWPVNREKTVRRASPQRERQELDDLARKPLRPDDTERRELGARDALCIDRKSVV